MAINVDFAWTDDGDLDLGPAKTDNNGLLYFLHSDGSVDNVKGSDGVTINDVGLAYGSNTDKIVIMNRLKTDAPDWFHYPTMGGNLTDLIGEPNTKQTGDLGISLIVSALTYQNLYTPNQVSVRAVPVSAEEILFIISVTKQSTAPYQLPLVFNLEHGLLSIYGE